MQNLAASVHSYESFGRAVVASILSATANQKSESGKPLQATFNVKPVSPIRVADMGAGWVAGSAGDAGAAGTAGQTDRGCVNVVFSIGNGPAHSIKVCNPM